MRTRISSVRPEVPGSSGNSYSRSTCVYLPAIRQTTIRGRPHLTSGYIAEKLMRRHFSFRPNYRVYSLHYEHTGGSADSIAVRRFK